MLLVFRLWLFIQISITSGNHFTFDATNLVSTTDNWLHEEIPCIGDRIRFDNTVPVVAFMDHNVNVESIQLPDNGLIVFTDNGVDLGGDANWQCEKFNENAKDVFFNRDSRHDISFYNPANWIPEQRRFLHMNQVPSEEDDVDVSSMSSAQIYLDLPVKVNTFKFYKRERMTTEDFNVLLRSMEGQFQINLARPWAHESDQGGVQRMIAEDAITVHNKDLRLVAEGTVNSNSNNETLATICSYVQCPGTTQKQCIDSFIPFGHCCPVCGTRIEMVAMQLNFEKAKAVVFTVLSEMESDAHIFATFERKTVDWGTSMYEIAIISSENITLDEDFHKRATNMILERLTVTMKTNQEQAILKVNILSSKIDRTVRTESKVIACLIYGCIIIGLVGMYAYQNVDVTVSRHNLFSPVIKYRRQNDDVAIEMDGVGEEEIPEEDEVETEEVVPKEPAVESVEEDDVEDWRNINPNFTLASSDDNQTSFEMMETFRNEDSEDEKEDITDVVTEDVNVNENPEVMKNEVEEDIEEQEEEVPVDEPIEPESLIPEDIAVENEDLMSSEEIHSSSENLIIKEDNEAEEVANILDINPNFVEEEASEPVENREESEKETEEKSEDVMNSEEMDLVQL